MSEPLLDDVNLCGRGQIGSPWDRFCLDWEGANAGIDFALIGGGECSMYPESKIMKGLSLDHYYLFEVEIKTLPKEYESCRGLYKAFH
ncbi:hypothetical protein MA16_Dca023954 [Dendrobium catenatum]|uniref:Uncharacterized protein n=1 Tax=Dendrobium catenatum TaxID=906689 RepID=A0A2I0VJG3_9ASPA|nr:hypothetical protein MA16_Dca023954 [Dendrobium catenatum]